MNVVERLIESVTSATPPENIASIAVVAVTKDGEILHGWDHDGKPNFIGIIAAAEVLKHRIIASSFEMPK